MTGAKTKLRNVERCSRLLEQIEIRSCGLREERRSNDKEQKDAKKTSDVAIIGPGHATPILFKNPRIAV